MHHYTTKTSYTFLLKDDDMRNIWQLDVPEMAISHPALMHGMLALSAMHVAYLRSNECSKWVELACKHQDTALTLFRSALSTVNEKSLEPVFALSIILCISSQSYSKFAVATHQGGTVPIDDFVEPLLHSRGAHRLVNMATNSISSGPLGPLLKSVPEGNTSGDSSYLTPSAVDQFRRLNDAVEKLQSEGSRTKMTLRCALQTLADIYSAVIKARIRGNSQHPAAMWKWPNMVSQDYIDLLQANHPMALIIFAHFVILSRVFDEWFLLGYGDRAVLSISDTLPASWRSFLRWPEDQLRDGMPAINSVAVRNT
jgi:hypothetical protein